LHSDKSQTLRLTVTNAETRKPTAPRSAVRSICDTCSTTSIATTLWVHLRSPSRSRSDRQNQDAFAKMSPSRARFRRSFVLNHTLQSRPKSQRETVTNRWNAQHSNDLLSRGLLRTRAWHVALAIGPSTRTLARPRNRKRQTLARTRDLPAPAYLWYT